MNNISPCFTGTIISDHKCKETTPEQDAGFLNDISQTINKQLNLTAEPSELIYFDDRDLNSDVFTVHHRKEGGGKQYRKFEMDFSSIMDARARAKESASHQVNKVDLPETFFTVNFTPWKKMGGARNSTHTLLISPQDMVPKVREAFDNLLLTLTKFKNSLKHSKNVESASFFSYLQEGVRLLLDKDKSAAH